MDGLDEISMFYFFLAFFLEPTGHHIPIKLYIIYFETEGVIGIIILLMDYYIYIFIYIYVRFKLGQVAPRAWTGQVW